MSDPARACLVAAFELLAARALTEKQLSERLARRGFEEEPIAVAVAECRRRGYIDDAGFADRWVESRGATRGRRALAFELRQRGVEEATAQGALEGRSDEDEAVACRAVAVRRVGESPAERTPQARKRLADYLARRGFSWAAIGPVLRQLYDGADGGAEGGD